MRLAPLAAASVVTALCAATILPHLPPAAAGDDRPDAPLVAADRHEAEGRALLERGEKVAAAKHMIEAWSLRARAWAGEGRRETPAALERLAALRAKSSAAEQEAHALRAAGKTEEADARIQDATRLWKEAEAVEAALRRQKAEREKASRTSKDTDAGVALERKRALEAKAKTLEAEAADLWAAGRMDEAEARLAKAKAVRAAAAEAAPAPKAKGDDARPELRVKGGDDARPALKVGAEARRGAEAELVGEVRRLRQQVDELRAALEELRARLPAPAATPAK